MMDTVLLHIVLKAIDLLLPPIATRFAAAWIWLYTLPAPEHDRENRREEDRSDLSDEISHYRAEGYGPADRSWRIFLRTVCGMKGDIAWCASYIPAMLVEKLTGGREGIKRPETLGLVVSGLAVASVMNGLSLMSDDGWTMTTGLSLNGGLLVAIGFVWKQHLAWVRRMIGLLIVLVTAAMAYVIVWVVIQHSLHQTPVFYPALLGWLSVVLSMMIAERTIRIRVFRGQWRLVFMCWALIAIASIAVASFFTDGIVVLLVGWAHAASIPLIFAMLFVMIFIAALGWYGVFRGGIASIELLIATIRRLR